jgi:hypothetical protein
MTKAELFTELRRLVDGQRAVLLDLSIALHDLEHEHQAVAKRRAESELRASDPLANSTAHEEYRPT